MLDKDGNRVDRRNAQDIFTPLYNHQIPPGAGQTVHYKLQVPEDLTAPVTIEVKLQYRKFDQRYMNIVAQANEKLGRTIRDHEPGKPYCNNLPITTLATDRITLPVTGVQATVTNPPRKIPPWQRWNDCGIGLLLKGKAELRQAEEAFQHVEQLGRWDGPMNLARVYNTEGRLDEAVQALDRAAQYSEAEGYPRWTWAWLSGTVNRQQGHLQDAIRNLRSVLEDRTPEIERRRFDFSLDFKVINLLGQTQFDLARLRTRQGRQEEAVQLLRQAVETFHQTLAIDSEDVTAHHNLQLLYSELGDAENARKHAQLHQRYKPDDNAQGRAVRLARQRYPAADHAAEMVVRYSLQRPGAPGYTDASAIAHVDSTATPSIVESE
jgi:tetratricopeptide (TPR) repeat protein